MQGFRAHAHHVPVVRELQLQAGMVSRLYGDDVGTEVWAKQETNGFDDIRMFGFVSGKGEHRKLLIRAQHHHLRSKHHSVRDTECERENLAF